MVGGRVRWPLEHSFGALCPGGFSERGCIMTGQDPSLPIYLVIKGSIYDVTPGKDFYGAGGGYNLFAGPLCQLVAAWMQLTLYLVTTWFD